jgi:curved DNA-binding protein CbpA
VSQRSLYQILNVAQDAEPVVIEAAYRALMKRYHPDHGGGAPFSGDAATINEAFAVLKDPARRAEYDHRLWTRQQAHRIAELRRPRPPASYRLFGWSGWVLALLFGFALIAIASEKSVGSPVEQPALAEPRVPVEESRRDSERTTLAEELGLHLPDSEAVLTAVRAERLSKPARAKQERIREAEAETLPAYRSERRRSATRGGRQAEDFLEREGYIY